MMTIVIDNMIYANGSVPSMFRRRSTGVRAQNPHQERHQKTPSLCKHVSGTVPQLTGIV
jgi:hypothetical protein